MCTDPQSLQVTTTQSGPALEMIVKLLQKNLESAFKLNVCHIGFVPLISSPPSEK